MKKVVITAVCILTATLIKAQEDYTRALDGIAWVKITSSANLTIMAHEANEILIESRSSNRAPERSKGLRLVGAGGEDNTNVGFSVIQEGNDLIVTNLKKNANAKIYLPKNQKVAVKSTWNGNILMEGFTNEIEANCQLNGGITIEKVSGPITANSLNGAVEIIFDDIEQNSPSSIFTTNGVVDITLPGNTKADLSMSSYNGDVYTNFDIKSKTTEGMKKVSSKKTSGTINGGGVSLKLRSTNGNIYLRKE